MAEMTQSDTELVYKYLNDRVREDVEAEAYDTALDEFDDIEALEAANDDPESSFSWAGITYEFERRNRDRDELVPLAGVEPDQEPEVYDLAHDFGWLVIKEIREEICDLQSSTNFSPREFVAFVLSKSDLTYEAAASEMGISDGTFASKMSREVMPELERARQTIEIANRIDA
jgi:DNA-directed RNA polymerase specialized sigma24 family protein